MIKSQFEYLATIKISVKPIILVIFVVNAIIFNRITQTKTPSIHVQSHTCTHTHTQFFLNNE